MNLEAPPCIRQVQPDLPRNDVRTLVPLSKIATVRAEIYVSRDGEPEILECVILIPTEAEGEAMAYLKKRPQLPAEVFLRVFVAHWRIGVNLNQPIPFHA